MTILVFLVLIIALIIIRVDLYVILGLASIYLYLFFGDGNIEYIVQDIYMSVNHEMLIAIPLFLLAGNIMARGKMSTCLVNLAREIAAPLPGGLAISIVMSCAMFSAASGSSTVTLLAVGSTMYPALLQAGYPKKLSLGLLSSAGTLGIIIPPSIPLILYGMATRTSIADLFLAGIGPSIVLTSLLAAYAYFTSRMRKGRPWDIDAIASAFRYGIPALGMPVIILGGIYSGYFTATEAAAVAVAYVTLIELFVYKDLLLSDYKEAILATISLIGILIPILAFASSLNMFMTYEQAPTALISYVESLVDSRITFLFAVTVLLFIVGCFIDITPAILILAPILTPLAIHYGIDPVHFGIIMIVNLELGFLTPPMGLNIFVAMTAFNESFNTIVRGILPILLIMFVGILIIMFFPKISLFLIR